MFLIIFFKISRRQKQKRKKFGRRNFFFFFFFKHLLFFSSLLLLYLFFKIRSSAKFKKKKIFSFFNLTRLYTFFSSECVVLQYLKIKNYNQQKVFISFPLSLFFISFLFIENGCRFCCFSLLKSLLLLFHIFHYCGTLFQI